MHVRGKAIDLLDEARRLHREATETRTFNRAAWEYVEKALDELLYGKDSPTLEERQTEALERQANAQELCALALAIDTVAPEGDRARAANDAIRAKLDLILGTTAAPQAELVHLPGSLDFTAEPIASPQSRSVVRARCGLEEAHVQTLNVALVTCRRCREAAGLP